MDIRQRTGLTFEYGLAMPPRYVQGWPTDRWLDAVATAGYSHVILQSDPFWRPEADRRDEDYFQHLSLYEMSLGPRAACYRQWLRDIGHRVAGRGLALALQLWEPKLNRHARRCLPDDWKGVESPGGWSRPLCLGHPDAREWFVGAFPALIREVPQLDAFVLGIEDCGAVLCGSDCPRCGKEPKSERKAALYAEIEAACADSGQRIRVIPYDWFWAEADYEAVFSRLSHGALAVTRLDRGASYQAHPDHPEWSTPVFDMSMGCQTDGTSLARAKKATGCREGGFLVMLTLSGMHESLHVPYVPCADLAADKFARLRSHGAKGWMDFDAGGIQEGLMLDLVRVVQHHPRKTRESWLDRLALERCGTDTAAALARRIWTLFSEAVGALPHVLAIPERPNWGGESSHILSMLPMLPFLPERLDEAWNSKEPFFQCDPLRFLTPHSIVPVRTCLARALPVAREALALYGELIPLAAEEKRSELRLEAKIAELSLLGWESCGNFFEWAAALTKSEPAASLEGALRRELALVTRHRELSQDPEVAFGNAILAWERLVARIAPHMAGDHFAIIAEGHAHWKHPAGFPELVGDCHSWKIANLERQIELAGLAAGVERRTTNEHE